MTRRLVLTCALAVALAICPWGHAYVEVPHTLGRVVHESTNILVVEVTKVNREKGLVICKRVEDLKGKHAKDEIKYNIGTGQRGFHPRESQNVMKWAEVGQKAVLFHNGQASETCIGTYWFQCYPENDWWGMSHAEPFLLRTYYGDVDKLINAVKLIAAGKEVVVSCLADGNKDQLHQRKGKVQRLKASLKLMEYNAKRDFVGFGYGDGNDPVEEYKTFVVLKESSEGWKYARATNEVLAGDKWRTADFDDKAWKTGQAPLGHGEEEIAKRKGTTIADKGVAFAFRRWVEVSGDVLKQKDVTFRLCVASDDNAVIYVNGQLADKDPAEDHEFAYWNQDVEIPAKLFKAGKNLVAVFVKNKAGSSDLYLDMELSAQVPIPKVVKKPEPGTEVKPDPNKTGPKPLVPEPPPGPKDALSVDKDKKTVTVACKVAPRKLPNLGEVYPIEVGATYPSPAGQKAHETVVTFGGVRPSEVHKALESLGLKPGQPARGEGKAKGPELKVSLEFTGDDGKVKRVPLESVLVSKEKKPLGGVTWIFTGSAFRQPDPEKDDKAYGADLTGTLISLFPVTDDTVIQTQLTLKDESNLKLEVDAKALPKEGTEMKLILEPR